MIAYCWRTGVIEFGQRCPRGALKILGGEASVVRRVIVGSARHARVGDRLLVPGIPEAETDVAALDALKRFQASCAKAAAAAPAMVGASS